MIPSIFGAALTFSSIPTVGYPWTTRNSITGYGWSAITYGNGLYVAVGGNHSIVSSDGINWAIYEIDPSNLFFAICAGALDFGPGIFVAVGQGIYTSIDGAGWTEQVNPLDPEVETYVAVTQNPATREYAALTTTKVVYTTDSGTGAAATWIEGLSYPGQGFTCAAYNSAGVFVTGSISGILYGSAESALFSNSLYAQINAICAIPNGGNDFIVVGNGTVFNIDDSMSWVEGTIDNTKNWIGVAVSQSEIAVAINADTYTTAAAVSNDGGLTWTTKSAANYSTWAACCWSQELLLFAAVASTGIEGDNRIMTAPG